MELVTILAKEGRPGTDDGFISESLSEAEASSDSKPSVTSFLVRTKVTFGQLTAFVVNHCPNRRHLRTRKRLNPSSLSEPGSPSDS
ncbi:hypothetical protein [Neobacillus notoginsengisoli]|uniref:hypothetical protein n=1 Tax=Neobacillus notoginsengisoli TaxID=1578198 RepID=UPI00115F2C68|nr:hypothetical protein [Neobacillus notoginsengisoli]